MPRTPIDYSNSCIYKIVCKDTSITDCYVGSTTCMRRRRNHHKFTCGNENDKHYNMKVYKFIRDNGNWVNWDMILVEKVNVNDGYELKKEERKWIEQLNTTLNSYIPTRTQKENYEANKEKKLEYQKEYSKNNKDKIKEKIKDYYEVNKKELKEYQKEYRENNKEKIAKDQKKYRENNKEKLAEQQKEWREDNKEKLAEQQKEWREDNKEYLKDYFKLYHLNNKKERNEKKKEKINCPICNNSISKSNLSKHQQTKKCLEFQK